MPMSDDECKTWRWRREEGRYGLETSAAELEVLVKTFKGDRRELTRAGLDQLGERLTKSAEPERSAHCDVNGQ